MALRCSRLSALGPLLMCYISSDSKVAVAFNLTPPPPPHTHTHCRRSRRSGCVLQCRQQDLEGSVLRHWAVRPGQRYIWAGRTRLPAMCSRHYNRLPKQCTVLG
jgi:hypothetical protein